MKRIIKHWKSSLQKARFRPVKRVITADDCVRRKIRMVEIQLKADFARESKLFLSEFRKPDCFQSTNCAEYVHEMISRHLNVLFANCVKNYIHFCVLNYFSSLNMNREATNKSFIKLPIDLEELQRDIIEFVVSFYEWQKSFEEYMTQGLEDRKKTVTKIAECIEIGWRQLVNYGYQLQVKGKLKTIERAGRSQYSYVCENTDSSCEVCQNLDCQIFDIDEAEVGKNLPPMHPNCRCSISAYPALTELPEVPEALQDTPVEYLWEAVENAVPEIEGKIDNLADNFSAIWKYFFKEDLEDTYGTYATILIDGKEYRINMASFESVVIMPDGTYLVPELVSEVDEQMLTLMKKRDSLAEGDPQIEELNTQLQSIYASAEENNRHVYWRKPYAFYLFGGDVTDRLNEYMTNTSSNYADMHDRYWAENTIEFYQLVRNGAEMDLKNQPEWQNSAYIFDGEVVSQDALGNINYGFFGAYCNFPASVLMAGAGFAQWRGGNWEWGFISTLLDDPRDTYRVFQGIEIYEEMSHP